jgi:non-specific protein-tyrosine kinase
LELRRYFLIFRKWAWFVILVAVISAVSSYFYSLTIPPTYRAETTMVVGKVVENTNSVYFPYEIPGSLAQAYGLLVGQPGILQATAEAIGQPEAWQNLFFKISAKSSTNSQLLQLGVTDSDPVFAARIANELAQQLILKGPISSQQKEAEEQRAFVSSQLGQLKLQIESSQKNLNSLSSQAALENDPKRLEDLNSRIASLQSKIAEWQKNYASLLAIQNSGSNLFVTVLAPAQPPKTPISPNVLQNVLLAAAAGLALAIGVVFLLEYLDDTIKDADDVQRVLGVSSLGAIMRIASVREPGDQLITLRHPRSPIAEAYRVLRTNLRFSGIENPSGALLVTSAGPGEGKTTTAANLAITMAQAGRRVVLVDCDLRRPSLHKLFGLSNEEGLSSLFLDSAPSLENIMYATRLESLKVIPSGPVPPNPAEMLDSNLMKRVFSDLRAQSDMLILDSPPTLAVADASILGARCSGAILVVDAGRTRTDACRRAVDTLGNTGTKILGVVLNKITSRRASSYYYYYYYSSKEKGKQAVIDQPPQAPPEPVVQPMKSK